MSIPALVDQAGQYPGYYPTDCGLGFRAASLDAATQTACLPSCAFCADDTQISVAGMMKTPHKTNFLRLAFGKRLYVHLEVERLGAWKTIFWHYVLGYDGR